MNFGYRILNQHKTSRQCAFPSSSSFQFCGLWWADHRCALGRERERESSSGDEGRDGGRGPGRGWVRQWQRRLLKVIVGLRLEFAKVEGGANLELWRSSENTLKALQLRCAVLRNIGVLRPIWCQYKVATKKLNFFYYNSSLKQNYH